MGKMCNFILWLNACLKIAPNLIKGTKYCCHCQKVGNYKNLKYLNLAKKVFPIKEMK